MLGGIIIAVLVVGALIVLYAFVVGGEAQWHVEQRQKAEEEAKSIEERQLEALERIHAEQKKHRPHLNFRR